VIYAGITHKRKQFNFSKYGEKFLTQAAKKIPTKNLCSVYW